MSKKLKNNLTNGEKIVLEGKVSGAIFIPHILLMIVAIGFFSIFKAIIDKRSTDLYITNKKIIGQVGWIKTKTMDAPLNKINNVSIEQGFFGKIFGYGTVRIDTSSGIFDFDYIKDPKGFKTTLMNQIDVFESAKIG